MKQKKQINKKIIYTILGLLVIGIIYSISYYNERQVKLETNTLSPADTATYKKHIVTKALKSTAQKNGLNVKFADLSHPIDYKLIRTQLQTGVYDSVVLYMYSDACPRCIKHVSQEQKLMKKLSTSKQLVIAVNRGRTDDSIRKHFQLPKLFHYPSYFVYNSDQSNDTNTPLKLEQSVELYQ